ncbi:MAG: tetratricopeptide repeat protein [Verrucomicrobiota bacterium]|nr:tetratricopeptide repeat protein [Verrucomicrobiota bacterium]
MKKILLCLLLAAIVLGVYAPVVRNGFVWDDTALVLRDPLIRSPRLIAEGFQHFLFTDATASDFYRPIQRLTYTLEYAAFGLAPAPYHIDNVLLHLAAAIALLFFARELLSRFDLRTRTRETVSFLAALIWAIHPVQSSAVAYVSGRADLLAALFGFTGLYLGLRGLRSKGARRWSFTVACAALFLLSALSKESGLIFLALWLTIVLAQGKFALQTIALLAIVLTSYLSLRLPAEHIAPPTRPALPGLVRPILAARAVAEYAGLLALPINLHMERDVESHQTGFGPASIDGAARRELQTLLGLALTAGFAFWLWRERRRDRAAFLILLLALISYLPISGIVPLNANVAEHWLYLPSAFLFLAAMLCGARFLAGWQLRWPHLPRLALPALALWICFLGGRTCLRTEDWKDQRTFLERTIADGGDSARMFINLGNLEMKEGRPDQAKKYLELAFAKDPEQPLAVIGLAAVSLKRNDFASAHHLLARALQMPLVEARAQEMLTVLEHKETGRTNFLRMRLAARTGASDWTIEKRFVQLLAESGSAEAASAELRHCLETEWYRAESWQILAQLSAESGHADEASAALARAKSYDVHLSERPAPL